MHVPVRSFQDSTKVHAPIAFICCHLLPEGPLAQPDRLGSLWRWKSDAVSVILRLVRVHTLTTIYHPDIQLQPHIRFRMVAEPRS